MKGWKIQIIWVLFIAGLMMAPGAFAQTGTSAGTSEVSPEKTCPPNLLFICDAIDSLEELVDSLIHDVFKLQEETEIHDQNIFDLSKKDQNLQEQINNIDFKIQREQLYEVINTDMNDNTAFCNDIDDILMFGYCQGALIGGPLSTISNVFDNFDDLDISNNPAWVINNGYFDVGTSGGEYGKLRARAGSGVNEISTPSSFSSTGLSFELKTNSNGNDSTNISYGITNRPGELYLSGESGYILQFGKGSPVYELVLQRIDNGAVTELSHIITSLSSTTREYSIKANRDPTGVWRIFIDGVQYGSSFLDDTYGDFAHTHIRYGVVSGGNAGLVDDVNVFAVDANPNPSAIVNIDDYNSPLGIKCQQNGVARVMCIRQ
jgi:hypothetical protein